MSEPIWKPLADEPLIAYSAFLAFCDMDAYGEGDNKQTYANLAKKLNRAETTMKYYSQKYNWRERAAAFVASKVESQLAVMDVGLIQYRQRVLDDMFLQTEVTNKIIMNELAEVVKAQKAGERIAPIEIVRLTTAMENLDKMRRRAAGMPTSYTREVTEAKDDDQIYTIGAELGD